MEVSGSQDDGSREILLDDGSRVILVPMLSAADAVPDDDVERNIFRVSHSGEILWQVFVGRKLYPRSPFTGIAMSDQGNLLAYAWDGIEYEIDIDTGTKLSSRFVK